MCGWHPFSVLFWQTVFAFMNICIWLIVAIVGTSSTMALAWVVPDMKVRQIPVYKVCISNIDRKSCYTFLLVGPVHQPGNSGHTLDLYRLSYLKCKIFINVVPGCQIYSLHWFTSVKKLRYLSRATPCTNISIDSGVTLTRIQSIFTCALVQLNAPIS